VAGYLEDPGVEEFVQGHRTDDPDQADRDQYARRPGLIGKQGEWCSQQQVELVRDPKENHTNA
jgi:hypothetical protein